MDIEEARSIIRRKKLTKENPETTCIRYNNRDKVLANIQAVVEQ